MNDNDRGVDFLAIGAHADDVEISMGGTVAKLVRAGRVGGIVDLTDAAMGTRGTSSQRLEEARRAADILGVSFRENLGLRDGFLVPNDPAAVALLVDIFRRHRPRVVFTHPSRDRHPDHEACAALVREAAFKAGLAKFPAQGAPWRPRRIFQWLGARDAEPDFCVEVSDVWAVRSEALRAYPSQFGARPGEAETPISGDAFREAMEARSRHLGSRVRGGFAEGFTCDEIPEVVDPCALCEREF
jgi:bacillithiol biosynthesis deacetylase BshB1